MQFFGGTPVESSQFVVIKSIPPVPRNYAYDVSTFGGTPIESSHVGDVHEEIPQLRKGKRGLISTPSKGYGLPMVHHIVDVVLEGKMGNIGGREADEERVWDRGKG